MPDQWNITSNTLYKKIIDRAENTGLTDDGTTNRKRRTLISAFTMTEMDN